MVGERLSLLQYVGFGIIVISSILLTCSKKTFRISKAVWYMIPVTLILAFQSVLQKYGLEQIDWATFYFWVLVLSLPFYVVLPLCSRLVRDEIIAFFKKPLSRKYIPLYGQNVATWISGGLGTFGLSLIPVTITKAIGSAHALMVHIVSAKGSKKLGVDHQEKISSQKIILYLVVGSGVFLTLFFN